MALEDLIAGKGWTNLPPPKWSGGLLDAPSVNRYQQIMAQMQQTQQAPVGLLDTTGGYRPEIYNITPTQNQAIMKLNSELSQRLGGGGSSTVAAQQAAAQAAFAQLTPGEQAAVQAMTVPNLVNLLMPLPLQLVMNVLGVNAPGTTSSGGVSSTSGSPMKGIASKGNVGQVANALATVNAAINAGGSGSGPSGKTGNVGIGMGATSTGLGTGIGKSLGGIGGGL